MKKRELFSKIHHEYTISQECENKFILNYYLIIEEFQELNFSYGVEVEKVTNNGSNDEVERSIYSPICCDREEMLQFIKKIAKGVVTPITLGSILEDNFT